MAFQRHGLFNFTLFPCSPLFIIRNKQDGVGADQVIPPSPALAETLEGVGQGGRSWTYFTTSLGLPSSYQYKRSLYDWFMPGCTCVHRNAVPSLAGTEASVVCSSQFSEACPYTPADVYKLDDG
jgi:hypothetical protein